MFTDTVTLIDQAIENLQTISEVLADDLSDAGRKSGVLNRAARTAEETVAAIEALLPKLQAARVTQQQDCGISHRPYCINCD